MMKRILLITGLALAASVSAHAQNYSQYGAVENFYEANVDINTGQYAGRVVNPAYWLVDYNRWNEMDSRLTDGGFVRLGQSDWEVDTVSGGGIPQKDLALAYAHAVGADVIIYAVHQNGFGRTDHDVAFYARRGDDVPTAVAVAAPTRRLTSAEATIALNRAQDVGHDPHVVGGVTYDPQTDTYNWIGPKYGQHWSKPANWFIAKFGPFLNRS